jgi:hypothetical protein
MIAMVGKPPWHINMPRPATYAIANSTATSKKPSTARARGTRQQALSPATGSRLAVRESIGPRPDVPPKYMHATERRTVDKAMEILASYLRGPSTVFDSPGSVREYICLHLGVLPYEVFGVLFLDSRTAS